MMAFCYSCSNNRPEDKEQEPNYSFLENENSEKSENSAEVTDNGYDQATANTSKQAIVNNKEWPYELDFSGVTTSGKVKTANLRTNYRFNSFSSFTSCLFCPDIENDILYYVNYDKDNYIYELKDGNISLLVEMNAYCLQLWDNKLYFLSCNQNINNDDQKTGDIYCYNLDTKEVSLLLKTNAYSLFVDSYGIFYQNINLNTSGFAGYRLDFNSTTPQKTDYAFYFIYNEYMICTGSGSNDFDKLYLCNRDTGEKTFLISLVDAVNNNLRFGDDYMVFTLDSFVYVLNLKTGKKDIYDMKSMAAAFNGPIDYFINDNILYMVNTNRLLALDLLNGTLKFNNKFITYDEQITSYQIFAGKTHYYTVYNLDMLHPGDYLIDERSISNGELTKELNK
jgi:hypothetical protein